MLATRAIGTLAPARARLRARRLLAEPEHADEWPVEQALHDEQLRRRPMPTAALQAEVGRLNEQLGALGGAALRRTEKLGFPTRREGRAFIQPHDATTAPHEHRMPATGVASGVGGRC